MHVTCRRFENPAAFPGLPVPAGTAAIPPSGDAEGRHIRRSAGFAAPSPIPVLKITLRALIQNPEEEIVSSGMEEAEEEPGGFSGRMPNVL